MHNKDSWKSECPMNMGAAPGGDAINPDNMMPAPNQQPAPDQPFPLPTERQVRTLSWLQIRRFIFLFYLFKCSVFFHPAIFYLWHPIDSCKCVMDGNLAIVTICSLEIMNQKSRIAFLR
jgi:hypothetical protein